MKIRNLVLIGGIVFLSTFLVAKDTKHHRKAKSVCGHGLKIDIGKLGQCLGIFHHRAPKNGVVETRWEIKTDSDSLFLLDQWTIPDGQTFKKWFLHNRKLVVDSDTRTTSFKTGGRLKYLGVAPRTTQANERRFAVFNVGRKVFRLLCVCKDEQGSRIFRGLMDLFERYWGKR